MGTVATKVPSALRKMLEEEDASSLREGEFTGNDLALKLNIHPDAALKRLKRRVLRGELKMRDALDARGYRVKAFSDPD